MKCKPANFHEITIRLHGLDIQAKQGVGAYRAAYPLASVGNAKPRYRLFINRKDKSRSIAALLDEADLVRAQAQQFSHGKPEQNAPQQELELAFSP